MAGRPITNFSRKALADRLRQREKYAEKKRSSPSFDPRPIAQAMKNWSQPCK